MPASPETAAHLEAKVAEGVTVPVQQRHLQTRSLSGLDVHDQGQLACSTSPRQQLRV